MIRASRLLFTVIFLFAHGAFARDEYRWQLLHTNDLHGFFEHTVYDESLGGYAALKHKMTELRLEAKAQGLETVAMDAGDFMEGSIFYMVDRGRFNLQMMNAIGYDYVALGNHDWLMGSKELSNMLTTVPLDYKILAANLELPHGHKGLKKILPYDIRQIGNYRVAIVGLTTDEMYYRWRFDSVDIKDPIKTAAKLAKQLKKKQKVDFVIAVTHLGFDADKLLAREVADLDLIVGGHSHTDLHKPFYARVNKRMKKTPIVQTGEHAHYLGQLILKLAPGRLTIEKYKLHPIKQSEGQDLGVLGLVQKARQDLNELYREHDLTKRLGETEVDLVSSEHVPTVWNAVIADAMREALHTDFSVHSAGFAGTDIRKGAIALEQVMQSYPRYFEIDDLEGWRLYKVNVKGIIVKFLLNAFLSRPNGLTFSGVSFDVDRSGKLVKAKNVTINGQPVEMWKTYSVALPEGVVRGGFGLTSFIRYMLQTVSKSSTSTWNAISKKIESMGTIKKSDEDKVLADTNVLEDSTHGEKNLRAVGKRYLFVPRSAPLPDVP